jgi:hypothetical protein
MDCVITGMLPEMAAPKHFGQNGYLCSTFTASIVLSGTLISARTFHIIFPANIPFMISNLTQFLLAGNNYEGLLLVNGVVYMGFASNCDNAPYHGWLFAYDAATSVQRAVFVSTPMAAMAPQKQFFMGRSKRHSWTNKSPTILRVAPIGILCNEGVFEEASSRFSDCRKLRLHVRPLEEEFQRELDQARGARCGGESELRRAAFG